MAVLTEIHLERDEDFRLTDLLRAEISIRERGPAEGPDFGEVRSITQTTG